MPTRKREVHVQIGATRITRASAYASQVTFNQVAQAQGRAITDSLLEIYRSFEIMSPDVMMDALEPTFQISQDWCPVDTGDLKASGYLAVTEYRGKPRVEIGYAKGGTPWYAEQVHEDVEMQHTPPTRAKWLQQAVMFDLNGIWHRLGLGYMKLINGR